VEALGRYIDMRKIKLIRKLFKLLPVYEIKSLWFSFIRKLMSDLVIKHLWIGGKKMCFLEVAVS
jgi:hypothetical protein